METSKWKLGRMTRVFLLTLLALTIGIVSSPCWEEGSSPVQVANLISWPQPMVTSRAMKSICLLMHVHGMTVKAENIFLNLRMERMLESILPWQREATTFLALPPTSIRGPAIATSNTIPPSRSTNSFDFRLHPPH